MWINSGATPRLKSLRNPALPVRPAHELLAAGRRGVGPQPFQQPRGVRFYDDGLAVGFSKESLTHRVIHKPGKPVKVSLHVQDAGRLGVDPQLSPRQYLEET